MSYDTIESAIVTQLRTLSYYDGGNCVRENIGSAFNYALAQGETNIGKNVCVADFGGGSPGEMGEWVHRVRVMCAVLFTSTDEDEELTSAGQQMRTVIANIHDLFYPNNRLGGVVTKCRLVDMTEVFAYSRTNSNWLAFFFTVEADEEMDRC